MNLRLENWFGHEIRFALDATGEWVAIAKDIASALQYSDTNAMTRHLKSKFLTTVRLTGMNQNFTALYEQGIYKAITRSQRPEAEEFEDFMFDIIRQLRHSTGLEGFQVFRLLDKEHQREAMARLSKSLGNPVQLDFIKANTIANKAVSLAHGHSKMIKKGEMTPDMLIDRGPILDETVELMGVAERFSLPIKVSETIYQRHTRKVTI
ncbi:BRO-N domain-containing protein [Paenibacillus sinopodophylli]|uniref:BRO-N domain-containing protein n=1 Tax=Paenibacillus sinopodophylli TaxID=1837342 RepID=UPI00110D0DE3|nr:BRO family protein [Paenibacillus sinopodophylli]